MSFQTDLVKAYKLLDTLDEQTQLKIIQHLENNKKQYSNKERKIVLAKHIYKKDFRKTFELLQQASRGLNAEVNKQNQSH